ncbi:hypothetical protein NDU88_000141 [Pleurodeles waltl]|uniref:Uncharacterized protein n=1 Tax=Pleurodeles waltl TaxID=8319 RepID=A0AAV7R960_PLEWA|nr:hypothetical protein NDU88_000141 [Pleurodeles waltl]
MDARRFRKVKTKRRRQEVTSARERGTAFRTSVRRAGLHLSLWRDTSHANHTGGVGRRVGLPVSLCGGILHTSITLAAWGEGQDFRSLAVQVYFTRQSHWRRGEKGGTSVSRCAGILHTPITLAISGRREGLPAGFVSLSGSTPMPREGAE